MSTHEENNAGTEAVVPREPVHPAHKRNRATFAIAALAVLAIGAAGGAAATRLTRPSLEMAPMQPVAIASMPASSLVTVKGKVTDIYGNKFVLQDASGKALIETGPAGDHGKLVTADEDVSVQGRFENGFVHASFIVHPDGKIEALGPAGGPPRPPHHAGPLGEDGPPPPPPPGAPKL